MKLVTFQKFVCYEKKYECLHKPGVERLVAINADQVVKVLPRKSSGNKDIVYSCTYYCEVITTNGGCEKVEGDLFEVIEKLSSSL